MFISFSSILFAISFSRSCFSNCFFSIFSSRSFFFFSNIFFFSSWLCFFNSFSFFILLFFSSTFCCKSLVFLYMSLYFFVYSSARSNIWFIISLSSEDGFFILLNFFNSELASFWYLLANFLDSTVSLFNCFKLFLFSFNSCFSSSFLFFSSSFCWFFKVFSSNLFCAFSISFLICSCVFSFFGLLFFLWTKYLSFDCPDIIPGFFPSKFTACKIGTSFDTISFSIVLWASYINASENISTASSIVFISFGIESTFKLVL